MLENTFSLKGKVALITGGGRGIGAGIAKAFSEAGADVALVARTREQVTATAEKISSSGRKAIAIQADITDFDSLPGVIDHTCSELGGIDILVNNAGGGFSKPFMEVRVEHIEILFRLEVLAPFELSRLALPHLLQRPGASIINTCSVGSIKAPRGFLTHYVVKAALAQLTKTMAADLGPKVRVNAIMPGIVGTPALNHVIASQGPEYLEMITRQVRVRRIATPEEIGRAAIFLASAAGAFTTGAMLDLTGGQVDEISHRYRDL